MAKFIVSRIRPPYIKGRIYTFYPKADCTMSDVVLDIDSIEPKKTSILVVCPKKFETVNKHGDKIMTRSFTPMSDKFNVGKGEKVHFMMDDYAMNINYITVSFSATAITKAKK